MQRRVEQADRHRQPGHDLEQRLEVGALHGQDLGQRPAPAGLVVGADHLAHGEDAALIEEHVLGAAQPDALGAEVARLARLAWRVGIGPDAERARRVRPLHHLCEVARQLGLTHLDAALEHLALAAVDGDDVALAQGPAGDRHGAGFVVDAQRPGAAHARPAHAPGDHGSVAGHAAARGEDAGRRVHAVDVLGAGLDAHQDHLPALGFHRLGLVGVEHDLARGRARRGRQAGRERVPLGRRVDGRVQQLVERAGIDAQHGLLGRDQPFGDEIDGNLEGGLGGALAGPRLQHPELAFLDRELDVLHVAVVLLERGEHFGELAVGVGHRRLERGQLLPPPCARLLSAAAACGCRQPRPRPGH